MCSLIPELCEQWTVFNGSKFRLFQLGMFQDPVPVPVPDPEKIKIRFRPDPKIKSNRIQNKNCFGYYYCNGTKSSNIWNYYTVNKII